MPGNPPQKLLLLTLIALFSSAAPMTALANDNTQQDEIARGEYLIRITGCNDCHTEGFLAANGETPIDQWLKGDSLGWRGPWGTTYPGNLRLLIQSMTAEQWLLYARTFRARPPMAWFNLAMMTDDDLRAMHAFILSLGDPGEPAPAFVPADQEPSGPYVQFPMQQ